MGECLGGGEMRGMIQRFGYEARKGPRDGKGSLRKLLVFLFVYEPGWGFSVKVLIGHEAEYCSFVVR